MESINGWKLTAQLTGALAVLFYIFSTQVNISVKINGFMFTHVGILICIGIYSMFQFLKERFDNALFRLSCILLFVAGIAHCLMATMQESNRYWWINHREEVDREIFIGIFSSQLGLDYAFDIFISSGVICLALSMLLTKKYGKLVPYLGLLIGAGGYLVNSLSFPNNPGIAGMLDPGPFFSAWFALFLIAISINKSKPNHEIEN